MKFGACVREPEVTALLERGQWPAASSEDLRAHVQACRPCRELIAVRQALGAERSRAVSEARLEPPGVLWWRAQLRRRNAAIERITRPFLGAQIFALAVSVAGLVAYVYVQARRGFDWLAWLGDLPRTLHLAALLPQTQAKSSWEIWLPIAAAMFAILGGVIVYLASEQRTGRRDQENRQ